MIILTTKYKGWQHDSQLIGVVSFVIESKQKSRGDQGHGRGLSSKEERAGGE